MDSLPISLLYYKVCATTQRSFSNTPKKKDGDGTGSRSGHGNRCLFLVSRPNLFSISILSIRWTRPRGLRLDPGQDSMVEEVTPPVASTSKLGSSFEPDSIQYALISGFAGGIAGEFEPCCSCSYRV